MERCGNRDWMGMNSSATLKTEAALTLDIAGGLACFSTWKPGKEDCMASIQFIKLPVIRG